jgi:hypothetical protein
MQDVLQLYHKLLQVVLPTLRMIEQAAGDKSMCPKSRLFAVRTILFNKDEEFQKAVELYFEHHILEHEKVKDLPIPSKKYFFESCGFGGNLFLN